MSQVKRAEDLLNKLTINPSCELTKDGANFVVQRFDPYHDLPKKPVGYIDSYNGHTVARCIKKTITINATSGEGAAPATTWNCHIWDTPILRPTQMTLRTGGNGNVFEYSKEANDSPDYGGLMIQRSNNDGPTWTYPQAGTSTNILGRLNLSDNDLKNVMRVTATGFEVIDETAELYKQGTLTAYRQNQQQTKPVYMKMIAESGTGVDSNNIFTVEGSAQILKFPPTSTANAMLIPDTKQWLVKEGAYVVADYHDNELPMTQPEYIMPAMVDDSGEQTIVLDNSIVRMPTPEDESQASNIGIPTDTPTLWHNIPCGKNRILPTNQSGVFLTGLNPQASITVNKIWYVECAPTGEDEELLSLCGQSPAYDAFALMLVSKLRRDCPIAVKLRENFLGEWFVNGIRSVVQTVAPWLSNANVVVKQVGQWLDSASTNNGYINPQSFVKGDVAKKVSQEKNPKPQMVVVNRQPPPAPRKKPPKRAAYKPVPELLANGRKVRYNDNAADRERQKRVRRAKARAGLL